jgi:hypothetical protein
MWFHVKCAGISTGEFDVLSRKKCNVVWLCQECKMSLMEIKVNNDILGIKEKQNSILQALGDTKRLLKERSSTEGNCKHGTPSTKENMLSSRRSVITEVKQNHEQSKATENKKPSQDVHKLDNSQTKVHSNNNDESDGAQLPQTESSEYPSEGDTNDEREFTK